MMEFDWDDDKAIQNIIKHNITFKEASTIFCDPLAVTYADPDHSVDEYRFISIGFSNYGRLIIVAHTDRENLMRIITAREVTLRKR